MSAQWAIGADIGGTFTDVVLASVDGRHVRGVKVPTTPDDPVRGVLAGVRLVLARESVGAASVARVVHATTLATNLILERRGGPVALIATKGFGDVVRIGAEVRAGAERFDLDFDKPAQLVSGRYVLEADERVLARGQVEVELRDAEIDRLVAAVGRWPELRAVAICLLHSYVNPSHERRIASALRAAYPSLHVDASCDVWPEYREYERAMTTVVSAYVGPALSGYVERLEAGLAALGLDAPFEIMQSSGGILSAGQVSSRAVYCIESGPAAGVVAASHLSRRRERASAVSFDMGGTTSKAGLLLDGRIAITNDFHVGGGMSMGTARSGSGVPIRVPVVDVAEIGTGGGSLAWVDSGGLLRVGPRSAGSVPGPACYGRGGELPTVTDADLVLGYLTEGAFLGGEGSLNRNHAEAAIRHHVAERLGFDVVRAAIGIHQIANAQVANAIRVMSLHRGVDQRGLSLIAYGGAGPLHAVRVAEMCGIAEVVIPPLPGLFSSVGLLVSERKFDAVATRVIDARSADPSAIEAIFAELEAHARKMLAVHGDAAGALVLDRSIDMRYQHQAHELTVDLAQAGKLDTTALETLFHERYRREFGVTASGAVEFVNYRVIATGPATVGDYAMFHARPPSPSSPQARPAYFDEAGGFVDTAVVSRDSLAVGERRAGPLLIAEDDTTVVVPPSASVEVEATGSLLIRIGG